MEKAEHLLAAYAEKLADAGIKCTASKKYFEKSVMPRMRPPENHNIFSAIGESVLERREKKYKNRPNGYHCIVVKFSPLDTAGCKKEEL